MKRSALVALASVMLVGCAVVKTTDVTDASYKRHQSISVLGWPLYSRVTDGPEQESSPRGVVPFGDRAIPAAVEEIPATLEPADSPDHQGRSRP